MNLLRKLKKRVSFPTYSSQNVYLFLNYFCECLWLLGVSVWLLSNKLQVCIHKPGEAYVWQTRYNTLQKQISGIMDTRQHHTMTEACINAIYFMWEDDVYEQIHVLSIITSHGWNIYDPTRSHRAICRSTLSNKKITQNNSPLLVCTSLLSSCIRKPCDHVRTDGNTKSWWLGMKEALMNRDCFPLLN